MKKILLAMAALLLLSCDPEVKEDAQYKGEAAPNHCPHCGGVWVGDKPYCPICHKPTQNHKEHNIITL